MKRFKNILVVLNDEGLADAVLARARWLAHANKAQLTLLSIRETSNFDLEWLASTAAGRVASDLNRRVIMALREDMDDIAHTLVSEGLDVECYVARGIGFIEIIRRVMIGDHDLVLKGAEQSFDWRTLGGADLHLLRKCPCPVWIINSGIETTSRRILAAVAPDPCDRTRDALNHTVMQFATSLAVQDRASLDVLNAWYLYEENLLRGRRGRTPPQEVDALLEETERKSRWRLDQLTSRYSKVTRDMDVLHIKGLPADVIVHHAREQRVDTLVMGTLGRAGLPGMFIGNTAESVLSRVECSVLAVKPSNFISPVRL